MEEIRYPHFFDVATATTEESLISGYSESGFYFFTDDKETDVVGPFESFEEAEASRVAHRAKATAPVDTNGSAT